MIGVPDTKKTEVSASIVPSCLSFSTLCKFQLMSSYTLKGQHFVLELQNQHHAAPARVPASNFPSWESRRISTSSPASFRRQPQRSSVLDWGSTANIIQHLLAFKHSTWLDVCSDHFGIFWDGSRGALVSSCTNICFVQSGCVARGTLIVSATVFRTQLNHRHP